MHAASRASSGRRVCDKHRGPINEPGPRRSARFPKRQLLFWLDQICRLATPTTMTAVRELQMSKRDTISIAITAVILCIATPAGAAETTAPAAEPVATATGATDEDGKLAEITVTAQRRTERLQDVPISAQVVSGQALSDQNIQDLTELSQTVPGVQIANSGRTDNLYIRGIGSGENQSFDQSVGTFIDDIYHGRSRESAATFLDIDHVEILKGPQSTYFGNNAIAGALNVVTKKPTEQFDASVRALYGQFGQYAVEAAAGGPLSDTVSIRGALVVNGLQGWITDVTTGDKQPDEDNVAGRISVRFRPNSDLDVLFKVEADKNRSLSGLWLQEDNCPPPAPITPGALCQAVIAQGLPNGIYSRENSQSPGQQTTLSTNEDVLTVNYSQWGHTFTSVTGFYNYHYILDLDADGVPQDLLNVQAPEHYDQFSQELRVASPADQSIEYLGGLYFQTDRMAFRQDFSYFFLTPTLDSIPPFAPLVPYLPLGQSTKYSQLEHTYSVFGSTTWNATDQLKLTAGLRGSWVNKDYDQNLYYGTATQQYGGIVPLPAAIEPLAQAFANAAGLGVANTLSGSRADKAWMPSARIQYQVFPSSMAYFSYTRGFKAGGFNGADSSGLAQNLPFQPEYVNAYEIGEKSEFLDKRLLLNLALFRSDYSDLQVAQDLATSGTLTSFIRNAAQARSQGVELETQWIVARDFRVTVDMTYLDSRYISYPNVSPTQEQQFLGQTTQNLSGSPTSYSPDWSGNVAADYRFKLAGGYALTTELSTFATSRYFVPGVGTDDPDSIQPGYARLDTRLSLESPDGHWAVDVIGKNLTDRVVISFLSTQPLALGSTVVETEQPRNFAVQFRYHW